MSTTPASGSVQKNPIQPCPVILAEMKAHGNPEMGAGIRPHATEAMGYHGLLRPNRRRRLVVADPDPAVLRVARRRPFAVLLAEPGELVRLDGLELGPGADPEQPGRVEP